VGVFSTACDSASNTSVVSKWRPFNQGNREKSQGPGQARRVGGDDNRVVFYQKILGEK
jgi:hypothetical protein